MGKVFGGMDCFVYIFWMMAVCLPRTLGITTVHHDKPEESSISKMATKMNEESGSIVNVTLTPSERQKRLLPYENFYLFQSDDQPSFESIGQNSRYHFNHPPPHKKVYSQYNDAGYQHPAINQDALYQSNKFTPFLESNAIPGPFRPIIPTRQPQHIKTQYILSPQPQQAKVPDYSAIYDKLAQLKLQNSRRPTYFTNEPQRYIAKPQVNFIPERNRYKIMQPSKTTIETFTVSNIDIPSEQEQYNPSNLQVMPAKNYENDVTFFKAFQENPKPNANQQITVEIPHASYPQRTYEALVIQKPYQAQEQDIGRPYIVVQQKTSEQRANVQPLTIQKPIIVIQTRPAHRNKPAPAPVREENYAPVVFETSTPKYEPRYEEEHNYVTPKYEELQRLQPLTEPPIHVSTESSNELGQILKQLQDTNTLPQTLTADNIDNSIKTLVRILEALKKRQKFAKPIVVQDDIPSDYNAEVDNESDFEINDHVAEVPGTVSQSFPGEAPDGGTPGKAGVDYPALSSIPKTSFNCKTQRYKGFFGDPDTNCQVWHYCDLNGGQASFLCPNGTIFSQVALTCDWWYNVKCSSTAQLYVLNERLYKYIIPLSPKFPEDYSGPLVDKYLALKFQEMEEKMRKEKKGKGNISKEKEIEQLQEIDTEVPPKAVGRPKAISVSQQRETLETIEDDNDKK